MFFTPLFLKLAPGEAKKGNSGGSLLWTHGFLLLLF